MPLLSVPVDALFLLIVETKKIGFTTFIIDG
jgi:hypothetical protein